MGINLHFKIPLDAAAGAELGCQQSPVCRGETQSELGESGRAPRASPQPGKTRMQLQKIQNVLSAGSCGASLGTNPGRVCALLSEPGTKSWAGSLPSLPALGSLLFLGINEPLSCTRRDFFDIFH